MWCVVKFGWGSEYIISRMVKGPTGVFEDHKLKEVSGCELSIEKILFESSCDELLDQSPGLKLVSMKTIE